MNPKRISGSQTMGIGRWVSASLGTQISCVFQDFFWFDCCVALSFLQGVLLIFNLFSSRGLEKGLEARFEN